MDNLGEMYVNTITKFGADITITVTAPSRTINLRSFRTAHLSSFISFHSDLIICLRYLSTPRYLISSASPNPKAIHPSICARCIYTPLRSTSYPQHRRNAQSHNLPSYCVCCRADIHLKDATSLLPTDTLAPSKLKSNAS